MITTKTRRCAAVLLTSSTWSSSSFHSNRIAGRDLRLLDHAIRHTSEHLLVFCPNIVVDDAPSVAHINNTLMMYYSYVHECAVPVHGPVYQCSVLFNIRGVPVRERMYEYPDLQTIIYHSNNNNNSTIIADDINPRRRALHLPLIATEAVPLDSNDNADDDEPPQPTSTTKRYDEVVIGGTFDHIHSGHKVLVGMAAMLARRILVVGMSVDQLLVNKKHAQVLQSYAERYRVLTEFVSLINPAIMCDIEPLRDMYGPSGVRPHLEAIVVSRETEKGGHMVNEKRQENGVQQLDVIVVDLVTPKTSEDKLSSTQLREARTRMVQERRTRLHTQWQRLCSVLLQHTDDEFVERWWQTIVTHYDEPHRAYHTLDHIYELMELRLSLPPPPAALLQNPTMIELSIWFHDIIYSTTVTPEHNERYSADTFKRFAAEAKIDDPALIAGVEECIMATVKHIAPSHTPYYHDMCLFLDMDLMVLAKPPLAYDAYCLQIRHEYAHYSNAAFNSGRTKVLNSLLAKDKLYYSSHFAPLAETNARLNIQRELVRLSSSLSSL